LKYVLIISELFEFDFSFGSHKHGPQSHQPANFYFYIQAQHRYVPYTQLSWLFPTFPTGFVGCGGGVVVVESGSPKCFTN
jgi:hypothetical protein